jgi:hypothetical protein
VDTSLKGWRALHSVSAEAEITERRLMVREDALVRSPLPSSCGARSEVHYVFVTPQLRVGIWLADDNPRPGEAREPRRLPSRIPTSIRRLPPGWVPFRAR